MDPRWTYEVRLGYHKKGDDAAGIHGGAPDHAAGFLAHAEMLEHDAATLRRLASCAQDEQLSFASADTHWIHVRCPPRLGQQLVDENLLWRGDSEKYCDDIRWEEEEEADRDKKSLSRRTRTRKAR